MTLKYRCIFHKTSINIYIQLHFLHTTAYVHSYMLLYIFTSHIELTLLIIKCNYIKISINVKSNYYVYVCVQAMNSMIVFEIADTKQKT